MAFITEFILKGIHFVLILAYRIGIYFEVNIQVLNIQEKNKAD